MVHDVRAHPVPSMRRYAASAGDGPAVVISGVRVTVRVTEPKFAT